MSAVHISSDLNFFLDAGIDPESDHDIETCLNAFDHHRQRVTGKHQALPGSSGSLPVFIPAFSSVRDIMFPDEPEALSSNRNGRTGWVGPLDVLSLDEAERQNWFYAIHAAIERQDLSAILDAVYWASATGGLGAELRGRLLSLLYRQAMDVPAVRRLLLQTIEARHEPVDGLREMSLEHLLLQLQDEKFRELSTARTLCTATDPQLEPVAHLRKLAWRGLSALLDSHPLVRRHLFTSLWQQKEPSADCRQQMFRLIAHWADHRLASERERFEGLYLLQRALDDEKEPIAVRQAVARELWQMEMRSFPLEVRRYIQDRVWPLCHRYLPSPSEPPMSGSLL